MRGRKGHLNLNEQIKLLNQRLDIQKQSIPGQIEQAKEPLVKEITIVKQKLERFSKDNGEKSKSIAGLRQKNNKLQSDVNDRQKEIDLLNNKITSAENQLRSQKEKFSRDIVLAKEPLMEEIQLLKTIYFIT